MNDIATAQPAFPKKTNNGRGISYPFIDLEQAIAQARKFYAQERKSSAPVLSALKHFGYSESSSGGRQTISALLQFGLLEDEGRKDSRNVKLTNRALTILLAEDDSPERAEALHACARMPKIYAELLSKYGEELPSDATLTYYLRKDKDFNPKTVDAFIKDFRKSLAFAGGALKAPSGMSDDHPGSDAPQAEVGDVVQWELNGALQFPAPRKIVAKHEHEGRWWAQIEGSLTGVPLDQLTVVMKHKGTPAAATPPIFSVPPLTASKANPPSPLVAAVGEEEWLRGRLSKETNYRLLIAGEMGPKEIARLIKLLEAQKQVLDEDAADEFAA
ncbi:hypothetical protein KYG_04225 [Acidovorax sp. NO-1]|uniref:hypothetical protein n=1 Tax=Acidovorax sp. NO-1 TaxID=512030 RepID=UPI00023FCA94|nr:hypothetical protein [Acidovorax sp. NO-1]EHL24155.1 hypothetical protein KYG_04225 [Acidovorax sp. NO-1]